MKREDAVKMVQKILDHWSVFYSGKLAVKQCEEVFNSVLHSPHFERFDSTALDKEVLLEEECFERAKEKVVSMLTSTATPMTLHERLKEIAETRGLEVDGYLPRGVMHTLPMLSIAVPSMAEAVTVGMLLGNTYDGPQVDPLGRGFVLFWPNVKMSPHEEPPPYEWTEGHSIANKIGRKGEG